MVNRRILGIQVQRGPAYGTEPVLMVEEVFPYFLGPPLTTNPMRVFIDIPLEPQAFRSSAEKYTPPLSSIVISSLRVYYTKFKGEISRIFELYVVCFQRVK